MVLISSTEPKSEVDTEYLKGEMGFIESTSATTITLKSGVKDDYSSSYTITVTEIDHIEGIELSGFRIICGGLNSEHHAITIQYCHKVTISNVTVEDSEDTGIILRYCNDGMIIGCSVIGTNGGGDVPGYAYELGKFSQNCTVVGNYARNFRHAFTTAGYYPVWNCIVANNRFESTGTTSAAIHTHLNANGLVIIANTVNDCYIGISTTSPNTVISNNIVTGATYAGIYILEDGPLGATVVSNNIKAYRGILITSYDGTVLNPNVVIESNIIVGEFYESDVSVGISIAVDGMICGNTIKNFQPGIAIFADNVHVTNNDIIDVRSGSYPYGIRLYGELTDISITTNRIYSQLATPEMTYGVFDTDRTSAIVMRGNEVSGYVTLPYYIGDTVIGEQDVVYIGTLAATDDETHIILVAGGKHGSSIVDVLLLDRLGITADDTNYRTFSLEDDGGSFISGINTSTTSLTANEPLSMSSVTTFGPKKKLSRNDRLQLDIGHTGTGAAITDMRVVVRYVDY